MHIAIENDSLANVDQFSDSANPFWVGGAQKYLLSNLDPGATQSINLMLSVKTGTIIPSTGSCTGTANGGSAVPGGVDFTFENIVTPGDFFAEYSAADEDEMNYRVNVAQEFTYPNFSIPGPLQLYELEYDGEYNGDVTLTLGYDPNVLPPGFDETNLKVFHYRHGDWQNEGGRIDTFSHTIEITIGDFSPFAIGAVPEPGTAVLISLGLAEILRRRTRRGSR